MPQFMLISMYDMSEAADVELSPEMIQSIIQKYFEWNTKLQESGKLVGVNKLVDGAGKRLKGFGEKQVVTDGPFIETKEVVGGYWIIDVADYDAAVAMAQDCPTLEFGGFLEIREIQDMSQIGN